MTDPSHKDSAEDGGACSAAELTRLRAELVRVEDKVRDLRLALLRAASGFRDIMQSPPSTAKTIADVCRNEILRALAEPPATAPPCTRCGQPLGRGPRVATVDGERHEVCPTPESAKREGQP